MSLRLNLTLGACLLLAVVGLSGCGLVQHEEVVTQPQRLYSPDTPVLQEVYSDSDSVLEEVYGTEDLKLP